VTIHDVYKKYSIPLNLQTHMFRVAAVGSLISNHLNQAIDQEVIVKTLLLHDMGNILKMNFQKLDFFEPADLSRLDHYLKIKQQFLEKYGPDPDQATLKIIQEITNNQKILYLIKHSHGNHLDDFINSNQWELKICYYADMRIGPFGLISLDERFTDLKKRYSHELKALERYHRQASKIEAKLQAVTAIDLTHITSSEVETIASSLLNTKI
jgi:hypothetical protein